MSHCWSEMNFFWPAASCSEAEFAQVRDRVESRERVLPIVTLLFDVDGLACSVGTISWFGASLSQNRSGIKSWHMGKVRFLGSGHRPGCGARSVSSRQVGAAVAGVVRLGGQAGAAASVDSTSTAKAVDVPGPASQNRRLLFGKFLDSKDTEFSSFRSWPERRDPPGSEPPRGAVARRRPLKDLIDAAQVHHAGLAGAHPERIRAPQRTLCPPADGRRRGPGKGPPTSATSTQSGARSSK